MDRNETKEYCLSLIRKTTVAQKSELGKASLPMTPVDTVSGSAQGQYEQDGTRGVPSKSALHLQLALLNTCLGLLAWAPFLPTMATGGETNASNTSPDPAVLRPLPNPQQLAAEHERAGRKREAAVVYEAIARSNAATRKVLARRLVTIYSEIGQTNKALAWARVVMRDNPDPQAYLAAVHGRLGQLNEGREILEREIARNTNTNRAATLRWQLADICDEAGDPVDASRLLNEAAHAAKGTVLERTALKRLDEFTRATQHAR